MVSFVRDGNHIIFDFAGDSEHILLIRRVGSPALSLVINRVVVFRAVCTGEKATAQHTSLSPLFPIFLAFTRFGFRLQL